MLSLIFERFSGKKLSLSTQNKSHLYCSHREDHNQIFPLCLVSLPCVVSLAQEFDFLLMFRMDNSSALVGPNYHFYFIFMELSDGNDAE